MHNQGYNYFNINKLTYAEVNNLIDAWNRAQKEREKQMKKASKK